MAAPNRIMWVQGIALLSGVVRDGGGYSISASRPHLTRRCGTTGVAKDHKSVWTVVQMRSRAEQKYSKHQPRQGPYLFLGLASEVHNCVSRDRADIGFAQPNTGLRIVGHMQRLLSLHAASFAAAAERIRDFCAKLTARYGYAQSVHDRPGR